MTNARARTLRTRLAGVGLVLAVFAACGDDTNVTTPPAPVPTMPTPSPPPPAAPLIAGEKALEAPRRGRATLASWDFTTPEAGTVEVTITYLADDSKILVWVTDRPCDRYQFERDECFYLTKSLAGPRPRHLSASGVAAGGYSLFVANDGPHDEQIGYEVALSPGASASERKAIGPSASARRP